MKSSIYVPHTTTDITVRQAEKWFARWVYWQRCQAPVTTDNDQEVDIATYMQCVSILSDDESVIRAVILHG